MNKRYIYLFICLGIILTILFSVCRPTPFPSNLFGSELPMIIAPPIWKSPFSIPDYDIEPMEGQDATNPIMPSTLLKPETPTALPGTVGPGSSIPMLTNTSIPVSSNAAIPSTTIPSTTIPSTTIPSTTIPSTTIPSTTIPSTTIPSTTIPSTTIPSTTIPSTTIPSTTIPSTTIPSTMIPITVGPPGSNTPTPQLSTTGGITASMFHTMAELIHPLDLRISAQQKLITAEQTWLNSYNSAEQIIQTHIKKIKEEITKTSRKRLDLQQQRIKINQPVTETRKQQQINNKAIQGELNAVKLASLRQTGALLDTKLAALLKEITPTLANINTQLSTVNVQEHEFQTSLGQQQLQGLHRNKLSEFNTHAKLLSVYTEELADVQQEKHKLVDNIISARKSVQIMGKLYYIMIKVNTAITTSTSDYSKMVNGDVGRQADISRVVTSIRNEVSQLLPKIVELNAMTIKLLDEYRIKGIQESIPPGLFIAPFIPNNYILSNLAEIKRDMIVLREPELRNLISTLLRRQSFSAFLARMAEINKVVSNLTATTSLP